MPNGLAFKLEIYQIKINNIKMKNLQIIMRCFKEKDNIINSQKYYYDHLKIALNYIKVKHDL